MDLSTRGDGRRCGGRGAGCRGFICLDGLQHSRRNLSSISLHFAGHQSRSEDSSAPEQPCSTKHFHMYHTFHFSFHVPTDQMSGACDPPVGLGDLEPVGCTWPTEPSGCSAREDQVRQPQAEPPGPPGSPSLSEMWASTSVAWGQALSPLGVGTSRPRVEQLWCLERSMGSGAGGPHCESWLSLEALGKSRDLLGISSHL